MKVSIVLALGVILSSLASVHCSRVKKYGVLKLELAATEASQRAAAKSGSPKSPLLEIVLRILDTIQIVPKKRSRRQARSLTLRPSPLFGRTLFSGRAKQPLMALSLESSETAPDKAEDPWDGAEEEDEEEEGYSEELGGGHAFHRSNDQLLRYVSTTSERFYDMVLGVLQVLESHARQEVHRARQQLETGQRDAAGSDDEPPT